MDTLRIRVYNVLFGDAVLVSVPDGAATRHILFDVGNVLATAGGVNDVFASIVDDIRAVTGGDLDLYVMTHEHLDHVQGLPFRAITTGEPIGITARHVWMTASAEGDPYYDTHPEAKRKLEESRSMYRRLAAAGLDESATSLLRNNDRLAASGSSTADCVEWLRSSLGRSGVHAEYVHRDSAAALRFTEHTTSIAVLAPEEDTSIYYGAFRPFAAEADAPRPVPTPVPVPATTRATPPPGVDAGAFFDLVDARLNGTGLDNLLEIDRAANNSSVVIRLDWRGHVLLFPGDAEVRSWKEMAKRDVLGPVHFLKLAHHGSRTGHPPKEVLDVLLPAARPDELRRVAAVSTCLTGYHGVPDEDTTSAVRARVDEFVSTLDVEPGRCVTVEFTA